MSRPILAIALVCSALACSAHAEDVYVPGEKIDKTFSGMVQPFLEWHCFDCHDKGTAKGDLTLHELGPVDEANAGTWRSIWAQLSLMEMPPKKKEQPTAALRLQVSDWIVGELKRVMRDKGGFAAHLDPQKGNFLDHDLLFGPLPEGIRLKPTSTPARLWRVTRDEHMTRLNELINTEPIYDPQKPGLRTHGDSVPTNHGGELKLYFGVDRITKWQGGTVAYATSVKSVPAILSSARHHGLENYPDLYTVNSAEATQTLGVAEDIIRYMAEGPLSIAKPEQITDDPSTYKMEGDIRGLPTALVYSTKVLRPLTPVYELMKEPGYTDERIRAAVDYLFEALTFRPPTTSESNGYVGIVKKSVAKLGEKDGAVIGLSAIFLDRDAMFRSELAPSDEPDQFGRVKLRDWELGLAVNHALRYLKPDDTLRKAIVDGRMRTREDVKREVERMLADDSIRKPRVLQFFRDYFDYDLGGYICKDEKALASTGAPKGNNYYRAMFDATASTDRLVELILQEDKDVLKQLLTTDKIVATKGDGVYLGAARTRQQREEAAANKAADTVIKRQTAELEAIQKEIAEIEASLKNGPENKDKRTELAEKRYRMSVIKDKLAQAKAERAEAKSAVVRAKIDGPKVYARVSRRSFGNGSMKPERILATVPEGQRLGILTHPSWIVSHSDAMDNHAILRGKWVRERLLGGGIPDVPITVDAMLPDEPHHTLRERMRVTREKYCWTCHKKMDPLGLPFEMYNHAGLFRTTELGKPVDTTGEIIDSGDAELDGEVAGAIEMIRKLAESERAEQVFVRHAFRFWMGRNETLNDRPVLIEAHRAYKESGGSMNALITSLVTSDSFLYRRAGD